MELPVSIPRFNASCQPDILSLLSHLKNYDVEYLNRSKRQEVDHRQVRSSQDSHQVTAGLDPQSRRMLWDIVLRLREQGKTILLTTHFMDEAQLLCDRIAIMDNGQIIALDTAAGLIGMLAWQ